MATSWTGRVAHENCDGSGNQRLAFSIGSNVRRARQKKDPSIAEFARKAGMSRGYVQRGEQNTTIVNVGNIARIATALSVTVSGLTRKFEIVDLRLANKPYRTDRSRRVTGQAANFVHIQASMPSNAS